MNSPMGRIPPSNSSTGHRYLLVKDDEEFLSANDATWIITSTFIIFTMQTGFSLLESGSVTAKNEVNIMVKNVVDVVLGGVVYWFVGYGLSFGSGPLTTWFCGFGSFMLDSDSDASMGTVFTHFVFHMSFATTATTIVSGAVAERCRFAAYCLFSLANNVVYCVPIGWIWAEHGFLFQLGAVDMAGAAGVHLIGGMSALVAAAMLGPRRGRFQSSDVDGDGGAPPLASPVTALHGLFVLWWGWLTFNCGSIYGLSNHKWKYVARTSVATIMSSFGGGTLSMCYSLWASKKKFDVPVLVNGILSSLVAITGGCALYRPWEALLVGTVSSLCTCLSVPLFDRLGLDDPVGAVAVHAVGGTIGMLAVGLLADPAPSPLLFLARGAASGGLLKGGSVAFLTVQLLAVVTIGLWSALTTFAFLYLINLFLPIRLSAEEELTGTDVLEHGVRRGTDPYGQFPATVVAQMSSWLNVRRRRRNGKEAKAAFGRVRRRLNFLTRTSRLQVIEHSSDSQNDFAASSPP